MSTKLHDLPTNGAFGLSLKPDVYEESQTGAVIDLVSGDGNGLFLAPLHAVTTPEPLEFGLEESSDQSSWSTLVLTPPLAISAPFTGVAASRFVRTKRYVRARLSLEDGSEVQAAIIVGQQKKTV
jgi:hypothetical protein